MQLIDRTSNYYITLCMRYNLRLNEFTNFLNFNMKDMDNLGIFIKTAKTHERSLVI